MVTRDVETRAGLEIVLAAFYKKVFDDDVIAHFFTVVIPLDLKTHLPVITDFWEAVVLGTRSYSKNVMAVHQHIHDKAAIEKKHLDRWVLLFTQTVDAHFDGPNATLMKQRAASIATLMQLKLGGHTLHKIQK
jgi:hemoglobin